VEAALVKEPSASAHVQVDANPVPAAAAAAARAPVVLVKVGDGQYSRARVDGLLSMERMEFLEQLADTRAFKGLVEPPLSRYLVSVVQAVKGDEPTAEEEQQNAVKLVGAKKFEDLVPSAGQLFVFIHVTLPVADNGKLGKPTPCEAGWVGILC
jgi:hypothetical protein